MCIRDREQTVTVSKVFTVTVKGQQTNMREQLLAKLDAGFASYGGDGKHLADGDGLLLRICELEGHGRSQRNSRIRCV